MNKIRLIYCFVIINFLFIINASAQDTENSGSETSFAPSGNETAVIDMLPDGEHAVIYPGDDSPATPIPGGMEFADPDPGDNFENATIIYNDGNNEGR